MTCENKCPVCYDELSYEYLDNIEKYMELRLKCKKCHEMMVALNQC